jgi:excisionase family DNA binding protein
VRVAAGQTQFVSEEVWMTKLFRVDRELEDLTGIKEPTWRAWILRRKIAVVRLGRSVRIPEEEILRLIREGTTPARKSL